MPPHDLMESLRRLHGEAAQVLISSSGSESQSEREEADTTRLFQRAYETCERVISALDPREGERS
jgi:hypothetical protein